MKKITYLVFLFYSISFAQLSTDPSPFEVNQSVTITIDENSNDTDCNGFNSPNKIYMHSGIGTDSNEWEFSVVGNWGQDDGIGEMTDNGDDTWSITLIPEDYFSLTATQASSATKMGLVFRNEDGSQEFKDDGCSDFFISIATLSNEEVNTSLLNAYKEVDNNYITIEGLATQATSTEVSLYNILGTKVMDTTLDNRANTQTISTNGLATGIYVLKLISGANQLTKKLIIK